MPDTCETVRIVAPVTAGNQLGYVVINKSALADADVLFDAPKQKPDPALPADGKQPKPSKA